MHTRPLAMVSSSAMGPPPKLTPATLDRAGLGSFFRPCDLEPLGITETMLRTGHGEPVRMRRTA